MKDKKKLTLTIVLVAVLVLVVVGATFAFFSASGSSANNAIRGTATQLSGTLTLTEGTKKIATKLIPVHAENENFSRYPQRSGHVCEDDLGNEICSIYEFTITNTANITQTVYVSLVPSQNTFSNLYFAAFKTNAASANYTVATDYTNNALVPELTANNNTLGHQATKLSSGSVTMTGLTTALEPSGSVTYTILVWLQDTGNNQNTEQSGQFAAGINVTTGTGEGVTGILSENRGANWVYTSVMNDGPFANNARTIKVGEPIPVGYPTYPTAASAMAGWANDPYSPDYVPLYLKHKIGGTKDVWVVTMDYHSYRDDSFVPQAVCNENLFDFENNYPYATWTCSPMNGTNGIYYIKNSNGFFDFHAYGTPLECNTALQDYLEELEDGVTATCNHATGAYAVIGSNGFNSFEDDDYYYYTLTDCNGIDGIEYYEDNYDDYFDEPGVTFTCSQVELYEAVGSYNSYVADGFYAETESECNQILNEYFDGMYTCSNQSITFDDIVTASYLEFIYNDTTYSLKGDDGGASYTTNRNTLFGINPTACEEFENEYYDAEWPRSAYHNFFQCSFHDASYLGFGFEIHDNGDIWSQVDSEFCLVSDPGLAQGGRTYCARIVW